MAERTVTVASTSGLHARPATLLTRTVAEHGLPVTLATADGAPVDAASILSVMSLGVAHGDTVTLRCDAPGADAVLDDLVALLARDLDGAAR